MDEWAYPRLTNQWTNWGGVTNQHKSNQEENQQKGDMPHLLSNLVVMMPSYQGYLYLPFSKWTLYMVISILPYREYTNIYSDHVLYCIWHLFKSTCIWHCYWNLCNTATFPVHKEDWRLRRELKIIYVQVNYLEFHWLNLSPSALRWFHVFHHGDALADISGFLMNN